MCKKICPIMSKNFLWSSEEPAGFGNTSLPANEDCFVECQESSCALWVAMYTTETGRGTVSGCAYALNAIKNSDGKVVV